MKSMFFAALLILSSTTWAQEESPVLDPEEMQLEKLDLEAEESEILPEVEEPVAMKQINSEQINIDGVIPEPKQTDGELEGIKQEIQKQKVEVVLNKKKAKSYKELTQSVEKLAEVTTEYLEEKREAQKQIAEYNLKVKCLQMEHPGKECDKFVKRRR